MAKPNIILINCDDLGYGDLGCYGRTDIATPRIDQMAEQGLRLTNYHAGAAFCLPSRRGMMTGVHPYRGGVDLPMPALEGHYTMANQFKDHGYATALIGKWHLGLGGTSHPTDKGFDYFYGTKGSNDWDGPSKVVYASLKESSMDAWQTPYYIGKEAQGILPQDEFTQRYTEQALSYIDAHKQEPFFLYLAHNMPHVPLFPNKKFKGTSKGGVYGDVVEELDWSLGAILDALEAHGIADNTLVFFTSDNGPWTMFQEFGGIAHPLRGEKSTCWEGGPRVPAIAYWPSTIKPGVSDAFVVNVDLFQTFSALCDVPVQAGHACDSIDMSPVLLEQQASTRERYLFVHQGARSYISGDFKIHFATMERTRDPDTAEHEPATICDPPLLFHLRDDISETTDVAKRYPEDYERLQREFHQAQADILSI